MERLSSLDSIDKDEGEDQAADGNAFGGNAAPAPAPAVVPPPQPTLAMLPPEVQNMIGNHVVSSPGGLQTMRKISKTTNARYAAPAEMQRRGRRLQQALAKTQSDFRMNPSSKAVRRMKELRAQAAQNEQETQHGMLKGTQQLMPLFEGLYDHTDETCKGNGPRDDHDDQDPPSVGGGGGKEISV